MYERAWLQMALHDQNVAPLIKFSISRRAFTRPQNGNRTTQERCPANTHTHTAPIIKTTLLFAL